MREPKIKGEMVGEFWSIPIYECESCGEDMGEWVEDDDLLICPDCAFKKGVISSEEYIKLTIPDVFRDKARAIVHYGEIYVAYGKQKFSFDKTNYDYRHSLEYTDWRGKVFERDGYKCQVCGQVGGTLNAHHIKAFKDYPKLRFDVDNGITLCERCHRELHKRLRQNGRKR